MTTSRLLRGFIYDAIQAYGLPQTIIDLDRAAQSSTKVYVQTAFRTAGPIVVNAVTKQGGPASPLKSTLTTSLGHRYLDDLARSEEGTLVLQTEAVREGKEPHGPDHQIRAQVTMVEATDDSMIFAKDLSTLQRYTLEMEKFQYAYGWLTSWKKTVAYAICLPDGVHSNSIQMPSITIEDGRYVAGRISWHEVPLKLGEMQFLRTRIDDTAGRFEELQDFINNFKFPKFSIQTPITLARKIVAQNIISRCRALLSLQHKATSAYTAAIQLYTRSGQLATAEKVEARQGDGNGGRCRLGCREIEDEHHIFLECPHFDRWRQDAGQQLRDTIVARLNQTNVTVNTRLIKDISEKAESFYSYNCRTWPLGDSYYYLGLVP